MTRADLTAEIGAISDRSSRQILITGEPGIGKSTVMRAAAHHLAGAGFTVLASTPSFAERYTAYSMLWDLLSTLNCDSFPGGPDQYRLFLEMVTGERAPSSGGPSLTTALALEGVLAEISAIAPVVIVIDDAQWADPESLAIVDRAFRRSAGLPVYLLAAVRTSRGSTGPRPELDFDFASGDTFLLDGLSVDELVEVTRGDWPSTPTRAQVVALHAHTGGNPLWALELIAGDAIGELGALAVGTVGAPLSLAAAVADRLEVLSDDAREVVSIVALLGRPRLSLLADVIAYAGIPDSATDAAEAAGFLSKSTDSAQTRHPLHAAAAAARLTPARRRELHRFIARAVDDPVVRAQHLQQSQPPGPDEEIAEALSGAASVMQLQGARLRAAHFAAQAVDRTSALAAKYQDRMLVQAQHLFSAGDLVACLRALSRLDVDHLDLHQYDAFVALSWSCLASSRGHGVAAAFLEAQGEQFGYDAQRLAVVQASAVADDLMTVAERGLRAALSLKALGGTDTPNAVHRALKGTIRAQLDAGDGLDQALIADSTRRQSLQIVVGLDDTGLATTGFFAHLIDDVAASRSALAQLVDWASREGKEGVQKTFAAHAAYAEITAGDAVAARRLIAQSAYDPSSDSLPWTVLPILGLTLLADGRHDELQRMVIRWQHTESGTGLYAELTSPALLGFSALAQEDWPVAVGHLRRAAHHADDLQLVELGSRFRIDLPLIEALLMNGEPDEARQRLSVISDFLATHDRPISRIGFHRLSSVDHAAAGDLAQALVDADMAIELARQANRSADEALSRLQRARVLKRLRKVALSRRELDLALDLAVLSTSVDVTKSVRRALTVARPRRSPSDLTAAEQRVLSVLVGGQSNKEIAAELFLSIRTVESHVSAILRKTGTTSRSKLRSEQSARLR